MIARPAKAAATRPATRPESCVDRIDASSGSRASKSINGEAMPPLSVASNTSATATPPSAARPARRSEPVAASNPAAATGSAAAASAAYSSARWKVPVTSTRVFATPTVRPRVPLAARTATSSPPRWRGPSCVMPVRPSRAGRTPLTRQNSSGHAAARTKMLQRALDLLEGVGRPT